MATSKGNYINVFIINFVIAGHSSCVVGLIPLDKSIEIYFIPASANKGCGMYSPVCGMVHMKDPLLLIGKRSQQSEDKQF